MSETDLMWLFIIFNTAVNIFFIIGINTLVKEGKDKE